MHRKLREFNVNSRKALVVVAFQIISRRIGARKAHRSLRVRCCWCAFKLRARSRAGSASRSDLNRSLAPKPGSGLQGNAGNHGNQASSARLLLNANAAACQNKGHHACYHADYNSVLDTDVLQGVC